MQNFDTLRALKERKKKEVVKMIRVKRERQKQRNFLSH